MSRDPAAWPAATARVLAQISREVRFVSPRIIRVGNEPPEMALSEVTAYPNEDLGDPLVHGLTERLYARYYCRRRNVPDERARAATDLLPRLAAANASSEGWDPGWELVSRDDKDTVVARSAGRSRLAKAGEYRLEESHDPEARPRLSLHRRRDDVTLQADYYYAYGESLGDRYEELVDARLYLNVESGSAIDWTRRTTTLLNAYGVPFTFKILRHAAGYERVDTCIVYLPRRHAGFVAALIADAAQAAGGLRPATPVFARRIAPGIALADNPAGGTSFGLHRMRIVAEALVATWRNGAAGSRERLRAIAAHFRAAGIEPRRPWLNPGNADIDLVPRLAGTRRAIARAVAPPAVSAQSAGPSPWLGVAERIGARLARNALWLRDECTWLGWSVIPGSETRKPALCTAGGDLYAGTSGIALFLAHLARATGETRFGACARAALRHAERRSRRGYWPVGAYSGVAGLLHSALEVSTSLQDAEADDTARRLFTRLAGARPMDLEVDIIEGRAGAIRTLLRAVRDRRLDPTTAIECAERFGRDLLRLAIRNDEQWSWKTVLGRRADSLLGYGHGSAGIACALADLHDATADTVFREAAGYALNHEWAAFDAAQDNWPDRRRADTAPRFMSAWCSGAPGVALALARQPAEGRPARYLDAAIRTTRASLALLDDESQRSQCLCHGLLGNAEILLEIHAQTGHTELREAALAAATRSQADFHASGAWPCGIADGGESPGLMLGLAGIGMFFLRLHDPDLVSPLAL